MTVGELKALQYTYADAMRQSVSENAELWGQVRGWALEADGRTGYSDLLAHAYKYSRWYLLTSRKEGFYTVSINLDHGTLIHGGSAALINHTSNALLCAIDPEDFNVQTLLKRLQEQASNPPYQGAGFTPMTDYQRGEFAELYDIERPVKV